MSNGSDNNSGCLAEILSVIVTFCIFVVVPYFIGDPIAFKVSFILFLVVVLPIIFSSK